MIRARPHIRLSGALLLLVLAFVTGCANQCNNRPRLAERFRMRNPPSCECCPPVTSFAPVVSAAPACPSCPSCDTCDAPSMHPLMGCPSGQCGATFPGETYGNGPFLGVPDDDGPIYPMETLPNQGLPMIPQPGMIDQPPFNGQTPQPLPPAGVQEVPPGQAQPFPADGAARRRFGNFTTESR